MFGHRQTINDGPVYSISWLNGNKKSPMCGATVVIKKLGFEW